MTSLLSAFVAETQQETVLFGVSEGNDAIEVREMWERKGAHGTVWSSDGQMLAFLLKDEASTVVVARLGENLAAPEERRFDAPEGVMFNRLEFSPGRRFLLAYGRLREADTPNVFLLRTEDLSEVTRLVMTGNQIEANCLQVAPDDSLIVRSTTKALHFVPSDQVPPTAPFETPLLSIPLENGVRNYKICSKVVASQGAINVAVVSGQDPPILHVFPVVPGSATCPSSLMEEPLPKGQDFDIMWSFNSAALLVQSHNESDASGSSYFGSHSLFHVALRRQAGGKYKGSIIHSANQGPIHDVSWSTDVNEFTICRGPECEALLFDGLAGKPSLFLGCERRRNAVRYHRYGAYFCIGGFGNMAGDLDVWDKTTKRLIGTTRVRDTVVVNWSSDALLLICATTSPRLRVDNKIRLLNYTGDMLWQKNFEQLLFVRWRPSLSKERPGMVSANVPSIPLDAPNGAESLFLKQPSAPLNFIERLRKLKENGVTVVAVDCSQQEAPAPAVPQGQRKVFGAPPPAAEPKKRRNRKVNKKADDASPEATEE